MALVDDSGLAYRTLADVTDGLSIQEARRQLLPVAAMSMLQDAPANAPYGWTHCLTLPQATLAVAHRASEPQRAVDVAATYVLGYRATQSSGPIDPSWEPDPPRRFVDELTHLDPSVAAATAWHAEPGRRADITQQLIDHAAPHHDAHLAKYTLACIDAATTGPVERTPLPRRSHVPRRLVETTRRHRRSTVVNITIFGATGQVGSRIVDEATARGHHVTAVTRSGTSSDSPDSVAWIAGDARDRSRGRAEVAP